MNIGKNDKSLSTIIEAFVLDLSVKLAKFIPMDKYKKNRLEMHIVPISAEIGTNRAGIKMTPETYFSFAIIKSTIVLLLCLPCILVFPLIAPVFMFMAVRTFFAETGKADRQLKARRDSIENELPRFVATVEQELHSSRDILSILENFKRSASPILAYELDDLFLI